MLATPYVTLPHVAPQHTMRSLAPIPLAALKQTILRQGPVPATRPSYGVIQPSSGRAPLGGAPELLVVRGFSTS
jgi:hypothetical protein